MRSAANAEVVFRMRDAKLFEEHFGEIVVMMLPGVCEYLDHIVCLCQRMRYSGGLNKLWPCSDDRENF